ncbi:MAG: DMT family transporter [Nodosilinea sp.]
MRGELAALVAACLWAVATVIFGRLGQHLSPLVLNLTKGAIAILLLVATLVVGQRQPAGVDRLVMGLLLASGLIGIGLGDTVYFAALNHLGPRRALLLETLATPMAALIALGFLGEALSAKAWLGITLTLLGVLGVISERVPERGGVPPSPGYRGVLYGVLAALGQATGVVLSRAALAETTVDPLWSSLLRLVGGIVMITGILRWQGTIAPRLAPLKSPQVLAGVGLAAFFGTYLAIYFQQVALKYAPTGIAQALTSTSPLFVLPLAAAMGDRVSLRAVGGVVVALVGVGILVAS